MNSEATRARNARKRAKLRAKSRGEGPNLQRVSLRIRSFSTENVFAPHPVRRLYSPLSHSWDVVGFQPTFCKVEDLRSGCHLTSGHEFSEGTLEFLQSQISYFVETRGWGTNGVLATLIVEKHGVKRSKTWRIAEGADPAAVQAGISTLGQSLSQQISSSLI